MEMEKQFKYTPTELALKNILIHITPINDIEEISIIDSVGRVLAEDIKAEEDIPPYDTSHFDGYAIRYEDTINISYEKPLTITVKGNIPPNKPHNYEISMGEAYKISTGGYLPIGSNTIIQKEAVKKIGENKIEITRKCKQMEHVIPSGGDYKCGEKVFERGHVIRPQDLDILSQIRRTIKVYRNPIIPILAVGDELINYEISPHTHMIMNLIKEFGGNPFNMGIVRDDVNDIMKVICKAMENSDLIITIGGCSVGDTDLVPDAILSLPKSKIIVRGIKRVPGRQTSFAIVNEKPILMLPGLIQSMTIGFYTLGIPIIQKLKNSKTRNLKINVKNSKKIIIEEMLSFERIVFGKIINFNKIPIVELLRGLSLLRRILIEAHGFIVTPPFKRVIEEGEILELNLFRSNIID